MILLIFGFPWHFVIAIEINVLQALTGALATVSLPSLKPPP